MENKPHPLAVMFCDKSQSLGQSWERVIKETFLPSYNEIGLVISDKKSYGSFSPSKDVFLPIFFLKKDWFVYWIHILYKGI